MIKEIKEKINFFSKKKNNPLVYDLVICGYPRSANTYLTVIFENKIKEDNLKINLKTHDHSTEMLAYCCRYMVPCVVPIRDPVQAILSAFIYFKGEKKLKDLANWYKSFYLYAEKNKNSFLFVSFETAINNPNAVIEHINKRLGEKFSLLDNIQNENIKIFSSMNEHSTEIAKRNAVNHIREIGFPNPEREKLKLEVIPDKARLTVLVEGRYLDFLNRRSNTGYLQ